MHIRGGAEVLSQTPLPGTCDAGSCCGEHSRAKPRLLRGIRPQRRDGPSGALVRNHAIFARRVAEGAVAHRRRAQAPERGVRPRPAHAANRAARQGGTAGGKGAASRRALACPTGRAAGTLRAGHEHGTEAGRPPRCPHDLRAQSPCTRTRRNRQRPLRFQRRALRAGRRGPRHRFRRWRPGGRGGGQPADERGAPCARSR